jgi:hypothetical protein
VRVISGTNGARHSKSPSPPPSPGVPGEGVRVPEINQSPLRTLAAFGVISRPVPVSPVLGQPLGDSTHGSTPHRARPANRAAAPSGGAADGGGGTLSPYPGSAAEPSAGVAHARGRQPRARAIRRGRGIDRAGAGFAAGLARSAAQSRRSLQSLGTTGRGDRRASQSDCLGAQPRRGSLQSGRCAQGSRATRRGDRCLSTGRGTQARLCPCLE